MNYLLLDRTSPWVWGPMCAVAYLVGAGFTAQCFNRALGNKPVSSSVANAVIIFAIALWPLTAFVVTGMKAADLTTNQPADPKGREEK